MADVGVPQFARRKKSANERRQQKQRALARFTDKLVRLGMQQHRGFTVGMALQSCILQHSAPAACDIPWPVFAGTLPESCLPKENWPEPDDQCTHDVEADEHVEVETRAIESDPLYGLARLQDFFAYERPNFRDFAVKTYLELPKDMLQCKKEQFCRLFAESSFQNTLDGHIQKFPGLVVPDDDKESMLRGFANTMMDDLRFLDGSASAHDPVLEHGTLSVSSDEDSCTDAPNRKIGKKTASGSACGSAKVLIAKPGVGKGPKRTRKKQ